MNFVIPSTIKPMRKRSGDLVTRTSADKQIIKESNNEEKSKKRLINEIISQKGDEEISKKLINEINNGEDSDQEEKEKEKEEKEDEEIEEIEDNLSTNFKVWHNNLLIEKSSADMFIDIKKGETLHLIDNSKVLNFPHTLYIILDPSSNHKHPIKFSVKINDSYHIIQCAQTKKVHQNSLSKYCLIVDKTLKVIEKRILTRVKKAKVISSNEDNNEKTVVFDSKLISPESSFISPENRFNYPLIDIESFYKKAKDDALKDPFFIGSIKNEFLSDPNIQNQIIEAAKKEAADEIREKLKQYFLNIQKN